MKKIIALFAMLLAFGYTANAQQKKATTPVKQVRVDNTALEKAAMDDLTSLSKFIDLSGDQKTALQPLFLLKHREKTNDLSQERKDILAQNIEAKLKGSLTPAQVSKLDNNPELMQKLIY